MVLSYCSRKIQITQKKIDNKLRTQLNNKNGHQTVNEELILLKSLFTSRKDYKVNDANLQLGHNGGIIIPQEKLKIQNLGHS